MPVKLATAVAAACLLVPASAEAAVTSRVDAPTMTIGGDGGSDRYSIACVGGLVKVNGFDPDTGPANCKDIATFHGNTGAGDDTVDLTAVTAAAGFTHHTLSNFATSIGLGAGADIGYLGPFGGEFKGLGGNDQLIGSDERDFLAGGDGADALRGLAGPDIIEGGRNNDQVFGGLGKDALYGEDGADLVLGGPGDDNLFGGRGNDALIGGSGPDSADGRLGRDRCRASAQRRCER